MHKDQFLRWYPFDLKWNNIDIISFDMKGNVLKIQLKELESDKSVRVIFNNCTCYQYSQESARVNTLENDTIAGICYSKNSIYISWIKEESLGIYDDRNLIHYLIVALDGIFEIICEEDYLPVCEFII